MSRRIEASALRASLAYWIIATVWVILTNLIIASLKQNPHEVAFLEMFKGWSFATIASVLLYLLLARETRRLRKESVGHRQAAAALRKSELHLKAAQKLAHVGSWEWDSAEKKLSWSDEMFTIFRIRREDFTGDPRIVYERIHPDDLQRYAEFTESLMQEGKAKLYPLEFRVVLPDSEIRHLVSLNPLHREDKVDGVRIMGVVNDVTDWKMREETMKLQASALQSAANAIVITDRSGAMIFANSAFWQLTGFSAEEGLGKNPRILKSGYQSLEFYREMWATISSGRVWHGHLINKRKDGALYHEEQTITPVRVGGGEITHFIVVKQDITERIRDEEALKFSMDQLHDLAARLESVREEERKSISHEVHDELGQMLTAIKMDILLLQDSSLSDERESRGKFESTITMIDEAMNAVRDISARLRPGMLDYLGLVPAIEWQAERFHKRSGIRCELHLPQPEPDIDEERSTVLFRILQEALTNVSRHSHADAVDIRLGMEGDEYVMSVSDNGIGIRQQQIENPRSFGLLGIRERLRPLGGRCLIRPRESGGTEIVVNLPKRRIKEDV